MKLGVIADIHADLTALEKALDHLDRTTDRIICAGDLTGYGKQDNEVIECIRKRGIPTVKGNHDSPSASITLENAEYLRQLPMSWREEIEGIRVYMCHGVPGINFIGFTRKDGDDEYVGRLLEKMKADIMIAGHTHQPHIIKVDSGVHFNPGSLHAIHRDFSSHTYGIIALPEMIFEIWDVVRETPN